VTEALPLGCRVRAAAAVALVPPALSIVSFARLSRWLGGKRAAVRGGDGAPAPYEDRELAAWVDGWLYSLPRPWRHTCLKRSAVLYHLFRGDGRDVELCIGVRRDAAGALAAHAWLQRAGAPYLEAEASTPSAYRIIARFPEPEPHGP
jgi:Transglutaminase-like superfamily